jgi:hypothetical protein
VVECAVGDEVQEPKNGYKSPILEQRRRFLVARSFTEKPNGSNSMETKLSRVNWRTDIRFLTMPGEARTFWRWRGREFFLTEPTARIGSLDPLPTIMC